jgi:hypothetical protein
MGDCSTDACSTVFHSVFAKFTDNNAYAQFTGNASASVANADGFTVAVRTSATAMALWKNGSSLVANSNATGGLPISSGGFYILARNSSALHDSPSGDLISAAFIGSGTIGQANLSSRINTFMSSLPTPINAY